MDQQPEALATKPNVSGSVAALWLGGLFVLMVTVSLPASGVSPPSSPDCAIPIEVSARRDWTTHAACSKGDVEGRDIRGPVRLLFGRTLDLNIADMRALQVLPSIGPSRAAGIVRIREERAFASLDDLVRVPGIGPKTVAGLASWASVSTPERSEP